MDLDVPLVEPATPVFTVADVNREGVVAPRFATVLDDQGEVVFHRVALLPDRSHDRGLLAVCTRRCRRDGRRVEADAVVGRLVGMVVVFELPFGGAALRVEAEADLVP